MSGVPVSPLTLHLLEMLQTPAPAEHPPLTEALRLWRSAGCPDVPFKGADFGTWLSRTRKAKGATLRSLQLAIGIERCRLSRIENNRSLPDAREWVQLCAALGLSPEERTTGERLLSSAPVRP